MCLEYNMLGQVFNTQSVFLVKNVDSIVVLVINAPVSLARLVEPLACAPACCALCIERSETRWMRAAVFHSPQHSMIVFQRISDSQHQ